MRAATNEAVKANMAIYSVDSRGLRGAARRWGARRREACAGRRRIAAAAMQSKLELELQLAGDAGTLSADTGGKAFFDSNDFAPAFQQIQHDTEAYYIIGFHSTNTGARRELPAFDGEAGPQRREDRLPARDTMRPADFQHSKTEDREMQSDGRAAQRSAGDGCAVYLQALVLPLETTSSYVPVSLIVPGSQIPFVKNGDQGQGEHRRASGR